MADVKISQLASASTLAGPELIPVVQSGVTKACSVTQVRAGMLYASNNLNDLGSAGTARTNLGLGSMAVQAASSVAITGGTINGTPIGGSSPASGAFTSASVSGSLIVDTSTLVVDPTNNRVGINTLTPAVDLHVAGAGFGRGSIRCHSFELAVVPDDASADPDAPPEGFQGFAYYNGFLITFDHLGATKQLAYTDHTHDADAIVSGVLDLDRIPDTLTGKSAEYLNGHTDTYFATASHTHSASDITSGTVAVARLPVMVGATSLLDGTAGIVPQPVSGDRTKFLKGDGTWEPVATDFISLTDGPGTIEDGKFLKGSGSTLVFQTLATVATSGSYNDLTSKPTIVAINDSTTSTTSVWSSDKISTQLATKASSSHTHSASDIVSGTLTAARLPDMVGATPSVAGTKGAVPQPSAGDDSKFLRGDGTWQVAGGVQTSRTISTTEGLSGGGDLSTDRTLKLSITDLTTLTSVATDDYVLVYDVSASAHKILTYSDFIGSGYVSPTRAINTSAGLSGGGNLSADRTISLDVPGLTALTNVAFDDVLPIYDTSASAHRKITVADLPAEWNLPAPVRLSGSNTNPWQNTSGANLFLHRVGGDYIALYDTATSRWKMRQMTGSLPFVAASSSTQTVWDFFAYWDGSNVALEQVQWSSVTARATALVFQNGILVKNGDASRRYVGSGAIPTGFGSSWLDNSSGRCVANYYNRTLRTINVPFANASWSYASATWRPANNNSNQFAPILIPYDQYSNFELAYTCSVENNSGGWGAVGIGVDSTSTNSAMFNNFLGFTGSTGNIRGMAQARYVGNPNIGLSKFYGLERTSASNVTCVFYSDSNFQTGLHGVLNA